MKNRTVLQIVLAVVVIGVLAVGGFALFRLGFAQGAHAALPFEFGERVAPSPRGGSGPDLDFRSGSGPDFDFRSSRDSITLFRAIPVLFVLTGFLVLAGFGAFLLIRRFRFQPQVPAGQPIPPAVTSPAAEENPEEKE